MHLARGEEIVTAFKQSLLEVGIATIFIFTARPIRRQRPFPTSNFRWAWQTRQAVHCHG